MTTFESLAKEANKTVIVKLDLYSKMLYVIFGKEASEVVLEVTKHMLDTLPTITYLPLPYPNNTDTYTVPDNINLVDLGQAVATYIVNRDDNLLVELVSLKDENSYTHWEIG